ncbi:MAG: tetratricopeptide repeat protein, partial [Planctomycetota bacterium]
AVQSGAQAKEIEGRARELLAGISAESPLLRILRERASLVLSHASSRRAAPEGLIDRTLALYRKMLEEHPERLDWRYQIFRLQLALDRTEDLERELRGWIVPARAENTWRIALGYILAENGRLEEAIKIFELVAANDELGPGDWEALANWYLATNDDARRNDALLRRYASMSEWQLARLLRQKGSELARRGDGVPSELDPDNLRALRALLAKARQPERHLGLVGDLYKKVKDFRLLESLADGMLGHSARQVYPYLLHSRQVIRLIHEEATSDELVARIRALARKAGPGLDRRALLMLGSLVDRRASEVGNQPGPHMRRALAAMTAAFQGVWLTGERRLMAGFLAALGKQGGDGFAAEQERQLRELCRLETERSFDRLAIAGDLQRSIWAHGRHAAAIDGLEAAIAEYREAMGSKIANETNGVIETLIGWLEERRQFTRAESWLSAELRRTELGSQNDWLTQRLYSVYVKCLELGGTVSLGRGKSLYQRARTLIGDALFGRGPDQVRQTLEKFLALHVAAKRNAGIHGAPEELERFAGGKLRELLGIVPNQSQQLVQSVATTLHQLLGTKAALRLLIERIETEPRWLARAGRGGWQRFVHLLAKWRGQTPDLGGLEPRLLAIVLGELERDLTTLRSVNRTMYQINYSRFWSEKRSDFARTAMKVVELHPGSSARQLYAARYLWHGLALRKPAIQVLAGAEERRILDAAGSYTLVTWLHEEKRFAESLPVLERLLEAHPDRIDYRLSRVRALHGVSRDHAALALLKDSAVDLHKRKLWNEASILKLAELSLACGFHVESVGYFEELIPLHQRTHARRGVGNGILSHYLSQLARAYGKLGNADKAVETASAAVVAWDPPNRRNALGSLKKVVSEIGDLDAYVERWSKKVLSTGMDAPVVRKVLGEVYLDRRDYPKAIAQLDLARSLAPDDAEVYRSLIRALEGMGDEQAACRCLLDSIRVSPLDMDLYESLARRYESQGDSDAAERAWTSLVEIMPGEAEGHRRLARHRETQKRYAEASVQWRQVVRVRSLEPDGWLALARVQVRSGRRDAAKETLQHVLESKWEDRFGDVHAQARRLLAQLAGGPPR